MDWKCLVRRLAVSVLLEVGEEVVGLLGLDGMGDGESLVVVGWLGGGELGEEVAGGLVGVGLGEELAGRGAFVDWLDAGDELGVVGGGGGVGAKGGAEVGRGLDLLD